MYLNQWNTSWGRNISTVHQHFHSLCNRDAGLCMGKTMTYWRTMEVLYYRKYTSWKCPQNPNKIDAWSLLTILYGSKRRTRVVTKRSFTFGLSTLTFSFNRNRLLPCSAKTNGAAQKVLPTSLHPHWQYQSHFSWLVGHLAKRHT